MVEDEICPPPPPAPAPIAAVIRALRPLLAEVDRTLPRRDRDGTPPPRAVLEAAGALGVAGWMAPRALGGAGRSPGSFGRLLAALGAACDDPAIPALLSMTADMAASMAPAAGEAILEEVVRPALRGERLLAFAYTERHDSLEMQTRAVPAADGRGGWRLTGEKVAQLGGQLADTFQVYACTPSGERRIFLVDRGAPGLHLEAVSTLGYRTAGFTRMRLEGCVVSGDRVLSSGDGMGLAQLGLNARRVFAVAAWPARMARLLERLVRHLGDRRRDGVPLRQHPVVHRRLGELRLAVLTAEALLEAALVALEQGAAHPLFDERIAAAKLGVTEHALAFARGVQELAGWPGFTEAQPYARCLRDFHATITGATTQEVLKLRLGSHVAARVELADIRDRHTGDHP